MIAYGFHGCSKDTEHKVIDCGEEIKDSKNEYDWLGPGKYFWEANPLRALEWAATHCKNGEPAVIGACIDLSKCLNLLDQANLQRLKMTYISLVIASKIAGYNLPQNSNIGGNSDLLLRKLDCFVVDATCRAFAKSPENSFTTVRGVFWEGKELYKNAGFKERNHIQICVRDRTAILCYFRPRYFNTAKFLKMIKF